MLLDFNLEHSTGIRATDNSKPTSSTDEQSSSDEDGATFLDAISTPCKNLLLFLCLTEDNESSGQTYKVSNDAQLLTVCPMGVVPGDFEKKTEQGFRFTKIFNGWGSEKNLFLQHLQQHIVDQNSFAVLSYGYPSNPKPSVMLGTEAQTSMIPTALEQIFHFYEGKISLRPSHKLKCDTATILDPSESDLEFRRIYDIWTKSRKGPGQEFLIEKILPKPALNRDFAYDLLTRPVESKIKAPLRFTQTQTVGYFENLCQVYVQSNWEALCVLAYGLQIAASTTIEDTSLQLVCYVNILQKFGNGDIRKLSYKFCDLAPPKPCTGTYRVGEISCADIHNSLKTLKRCLSAREFAKTRKVQIPVRDATLTSFLEPALMGVDQLFIISCIDTKEDVDENLQLLDNMFPMLAAPAILPPVDT